MGLFVGGNFGQPGSGMVMSPTSVITDRETMRKTPPDILLTNYKMLDYLLMRPKDRQLWARNQPTTLRYVVVDELHTFDGAQGTDLALLLRRLRARLQVPEGHLICVGTSATLGAIAGHRAAARIRAAGVRRAISAGRVGHRRETDCLQPSSSATRRSSTCCSPVPISGKCWIPARYLRQEEAVAAWFRCSFPSCLLRRT